MGGMGTAGQCAGALYILLRDDWQAHAHVRAQAIVGASTLHSVCTNVQCTVLSSAVYSDPVGSALF